MNIKWKWKDYFLLYIFYFIFSSLNIVSQIHPWLFVEIAAMNILNRATSTQIQEFLGNIPRSETIGRNWLWNLQGPGQIITWAPWYIIRNFRTAVVEYCARCRSPWLHRYTARKPPATESLPTRLGHTKGLCLVDGSAECPLFSILANTCFL